MLGVFGLKSDKIGTYRAAFVHQAPFEKDFSSAPRVINEVVLETPFTTDDGQLTSPPDAVVCEYKGCSSGFTARISACGKRCKPPVWSRCKCVITTWQTSRADLLLRRDSYLQRILDSHT